MINKFVKPAWIKDIKVLVWDLDGTLYQRNPLINKVFKSTIYQEVGQALSLSVSQAKDVFSQRQKKIKGLTLTLNSLGIDGYAFIKKVNEKISWKKVLSKDERLITMFQKLISFPHILLTDNFEKYSLEKISLLGLKKTVFQKMIFGMEIRITKPNPNLFRRALKLFNFPPSSFLMIGDSEDKDIIPAKKIGMKTCLVWAKSKVADISLKTVYDIEKLFI